MKISEFIHKCDETFSKYDFEITAGLMNDAVVTVRIYYAGKMYSYDRSITVEEMRHSYNGFENVLSYMWKELENLK